MKAKNIKELKPKEVTEVFNHESINDKRKTLTYCIALEDLETLIKDRIKELEKKFVCPFCNHEVTKGDYDDMWVCEKPECVEKREFKLDGLVSGDSKTKILIQELKRLLGEDD